MKPCGPRMAAALCPERLERVRALTRGWVDRGEMPMASLRVSRHGSVLLDDHHGERRVGGAAALEADDIHRIYSMTKPVTATAALILYERGYFHLHDPVEAFLPEFAGIRVAAAGAEPPPSLGPGEMPTEPLARPLTVLHLLTHSGGLHRGNNDPEARTLADYARACAARPLRFQPGRGWAYGEGISVVGRLIEVWSGVPYDEFVRAEVLQPLDMADTDFVLPRDKRHRLVGQYRQAPAGGGFEPLPEPEVAGPYLYQGNGPEGHFPGPSGGLASTVADYWRFAQMVANGGLGPNGARVLASSTVEAMRSNQLPAASGLRQVECADLSSEPPSLTSPGPGMGFGLGVAVAVDPVRAVPQRAAGEFYWIGGCCTTFWVVSRANPSPKLRDAFEWPLSSHARLGRDCFQHGC